MERGGWRGEGWRGRGRWEIMTCNKVTTVVTRRTLFRFPYMYLPENTCGISQRLGVSAVLS